MLEKHLRQLTANAQARGVTTDYEYLTLNISALFFMYAEADSTAGGEGYPQACSELGDMASVLERAIAEVQLLSLFPDKCNGEANCTGPQYHRAPIPDTRWKGGTVSNQGYLEREDRPVYPGGYDQGIWRYFYGFPDAGVEAQVRPLLQGSQEIAVSLATLFPTPDGRLNQSLVR